MLKKDKKGKDDDCILDVAQNFVLIANNFYNINAEKKTRD